MSEPNLPPGSLGVPFLGETLPFAWNGHAFYRRRVKRYGQVFKTRLFGEKIVVLSGHEAFGELFDGEKFTRVDSNPPHIRELLAKDSLPLIDGEEHRVRKALVLEAFRDEAMAGYLPILETTLGTYFKRWSEIGEIVWLEESRQLAATLANALFLGGDPRAPAVELARELDAFIKGFTSIPLKLPFTSYGRALRNRDRLFKRIDAAVAAGPSGDTVLGQLMAARDSKGRSLDPGELRREVLHLFFAAYSGMYVILTLLALAFTTFEPVRRACRREVDELASEGALQADQLDSFDVLHRTSRELRRYYPINAATFFARAVRPCEIGGFQVPQGWLAVGAIHTTLHDAAVFENPEQFDIDRFLPDAAAALPDNAYVPHSGGPRLGHRCPGESFITLLLIVGMVHLLRDYTWEAPPQDFELNRELFPLPKSGLRVSFRRRADGDT